MNDINIEKGGYLFAPFKTEMKITLESGEIEFSPDLVDAVMMLPANAQRIQGLSEEQRKEKREIRIVCPTCKKSTKIDVPKIPIERLESGLAAVRVSALCGHSFTTFIDKRFTVRGYQREDFAIIEIKEKRRRSRR